MKKIILFLFLFISATVFANGSKDLKVYGNISNGAAYLSTGEFTITKFDDDVVYWGAHANIMIPVGIHKIYFETETQSGFYTILGILSLFIDKDPIYIDPTKIITGSTEHTFEKDHKYEIELKTEGFFKPKYYYEVKDLGKAE